MDAVVLAGGVGKRLLPLTRLTPKPFLKVAGRPLYKYSLDEIETLLPRLGRVVVVTPPGYPGIPPGLPGWAEAVSQSGEGLEAGIATGLSEVEGGEVLLSFTGYLSSPPGIVRQVLDFYSATGYSLVMAVAPVATGVETYGFIDMDPGGPVRRVTDRPPEEWMAGRGMVFAGVMVGEARALKVLATRGYIAGLNELAKTGALGATVWPGEWVEVGYPWDLLSVPKVLLHRRPALVEDGAVIERTAVVQGSVVVKREAHIGEGAVVRGPAYIGAKSRVEEGAVVGPGAIVEDGVQIGPNTVVKDSVVMEGARVGASCIIEGSVIGEKAQVKPLTVLEAREPVMVPERLRGALESLKEKPRLGAIIAPLRTIGPLAYHGGGATVE